LCQFCNYILKKRKIINYIKNTCHYRFGLPLSYKAIFVLSKPIVMLPQNFTLHQSPALIIQQPLILKKSSLPEKNDSDKKSCKHRNENGWCSKSQRQCWLLTDLFSQH